jgi:hypothetical protein
MGDSAPTLECVKHKSYRTALKIVREHLRNVVILRADKIAAGCVNILATRLTAGRQSGATRWWLPNSETAELRCKILTIQN